VTEGEEVKANENTTQEVKVSLLDNNDEDGEEEPTQ
jgi:hypothetical protein